MLHFSFTYFSLMFIFTEKTCFALVVAFISAIQLHFLLHQLLSPTPFIVSFTYLSPSQSICVSEGHITAIHINKIYSRPCYRFDRNKNISSMKPIKRELIIHAFHLLVNTHRAERIGQLIRNLRLQTSDTAVSSARIRPQSRRS